MGRLKKLVDSEGPIARSGPVTDIRNRLSKVSVVQPQKYLEQTSRAKEAGDLAKNEGYCRTKHG